MNATTTSLEKESLEAHVDLCAIRYDTLQQRFELVEERLDKIETKVEQIHNDIRAGNSSMIKVLIGAAGTIVAGLLSTIIVILMR